MDELLVFLKVAYLIKLFLDEILHSLDIMVGGLLYFLDAGGILFRKLTVNVTQRFEQSMTEVCQLWERQLAKGNEIFDFNTHSITDECIL